MARTIRNDSYGRPTSDKNRKAVQVRQNRLNRRYAKQALVAGLDLPEVPRQVDWILH